jgi:NMD protein affecting ribosome stability and mRNA decay
MKLAEEILNLLEDKITHCPGCGKKFDEPKEKDTLCYDCFTQPAKTKLVNSRYGKRIVVIKK